MAPARIAITATCALLEVTVGLRAPGGPLAASNPEGHTARLAAVSAPSPAVGPPPFSAPRWIALGPPILPTTGPPQAAPVPVFQDGAAGREGGSEADRIQRELLHTDRLLSVVRAKVYRAGNAKAVERFAEAVHREREATDAYRELHYARATRLTREARTLAREASVLVGPPEDDPVYVGRAVEHADDALMLVRDIFDRGATPWVWQRYDALKGELSEARALLKGGATRSALARAVAVRDGVLDLLRSTQRPPVSAETAARAVKHAERAVEMAGKELGPKPSASSERWRREALSQLGKARAAIARREYGDAVLHSKLVERNLDEAMAAQRLGGKPTA